ncbi:PP2C family protein-serine/threonine phosphatase [Bernardetia sp. OM2101]|uniref:PP2C family protein-serine/threonine phosphatase n=1 Tax=Bernardetia sp. OM2101 TaxID=3344876 RepID=UPI0035D04B14
MSFNPLSILFDVPHYLDLPIEEHKDFAVTSTAGVLGFLAHIVFFILFFIFESHFMMYLNIGSLSIFACIFYFNRTLSRNPTLLLILASLEILVHATFAIFLLGWESNFHIYFFIPILAALVTSKTNAIVAYIINATCVIFYIALAIYTNYESPIAPLSQMGAFVFEILNIISVSVIVIIVTMYYSYISNESSKKLTLLNSKLKDQSNKVMSFNNELAQQTEELQIQSEQLEQANKHTTDSIRYALRIQEAVLPSPLDLSSLFGEKNVMVFYSPKDIVSGDFYWAKETNNNKIIVVADCTGHGVPGAMLTMIGESLLNNIVLEKGITEPAFILDALQVYFSTLFTGSVHNIQDGMDVCISTINYDTKKLHFAGARNPITYIQNGQMETIQGDKMSIGKSKISSKSFDKFTAHQIDVATPTIFYMYTDGYQDQFGGKENRKFYSKNLRQLFFDIHTLPIFKQKTRLKMTFLEWCNFVKQIDDVTIVGIKIDMNQEQQTIKETESERLFREIMKETQQEKE